MPSGYVIVMADVRDLFFHDLPEDKGNYWVSKLGKPSLKALACFMDRLHATPHGLNQGFSGSPQAVIRKDAKVDLDRWACLIVVPNLK